MADAGVQAVEAGKKIWVTLTGLPLTITLNWPFRQSTSGADFWVLHGDIRLEGSDGLHAPVAVNLSQTVREIMPSAEPKDAEAPVINALRKEVDRRQIEFLKSGKLLPVPFSSRHYDFKRHQWIFGKATDDIMAEFIERKVYWHTRLAGEQRVWIADPAEAQYVQTTPNHLLEIAARLVAAQGLLRIEGRMGRAHLWTHESGRALRGSTTPSRRRFGKKARLRKRLRGHAALGARIAPAMTAPTFTMHIVPMIPSEITQ